MLIQMEVGDLPGVSEVVSDHATSETSVTYDPNVVGIDDIVGAIVKAGYSAEPIDA
jgi:copper chaperone CopZ